MEVYRTLERFLEAAKHLRGSDQRSVYHGAAPGSKLGPCETTPHGICRNQLLMAAAYAGWDPSFETPTDATEMMAS